MKVQIFGPMSLRRFFEYAYRDQVAFACMMMYVLLTADVGTLHVCCIDFGQASAATSVLVYSGGQTLARVGVMGRSPVVRDAPILKACVQDGRGGREQYLADLQVTIHTYNVYMEVIQGTEVGKR